MTVSVTMMRESHGLAVPTQPAGSLPELILTGSSHLSDEKKGRLT